MNYKLDIASYGTHFMELELYFISYELVYMSDK